MAAAIVVAWSHSAWSAEKPGPDPQGTSTARSSTVAATAASPKANFSPPLQPLPKVASRKLPRPKAEETKQLDTLLKGLESPDEAARQVSLAQLQQLDERLLPAIRARIESEAGRSNRRAQKRLLLRIRREARKTIRAQMRADGQKGDVVTPDYLDMLIQYAEPESKHWRSLVNVLAMSRACVHLSSTPATRVLLRVFVRFSFLRIDTQLQLKKLGDHGLPALIEATRHPAPEVSHWAKRQLDFFGKAIPSETVQTDDSKILGEILMAYGRIKDVDAARLITSFSDSGNETVRLAARKAVVLLGSTGNWELRNTYEKKVGRKPSREWPWNRTAQELFREFDRVRLAQVYQAYQEGVEALEQKHLQAAVESFDRVITRSPDFTPAQRLKEAYSAYGEQILEASPQEAALMFTRAERLEKESKARSALTSLRLTAEAQHRFKHSHLADVNLLERAIQLDPGNAKATRLLAEVSSEPLVESASFMRLLWPATISALSFLGAALVLMRRKRASVTPSE